MRKLFTVSMLLITFPILSQEVQVVKFDKMENILKGESQKLRIFNFWATWCKPCVIEMPYFEQLAIENKDKVEMNFVSLDYADQVETRVKPFLLKKGINSKVYLIDDLDYNSWIDRVDPLWSGAIPATVFITPSGKKIFYEQEFKKEELEKIVKSLLNK